MPHVPVSDPSALGIDPAAVQSLVDRAAKEVSAGNIPGFQLALARDGELAAFVCHGKASFSGTPETVGPDALFVLFSCTKAVVSALAWLAIQDGQLDPDERPADTIPEFGTNGKDAVTVAHLMTHTSGFPQAPYPQPEWLDREARLRRFAKWRLDFAPGERFFYHPTSSLWVVTELLERRLGGDLRSLVRERIAEPLGLDDLHVGLPAEHHSRVADIEHRGDEVTKAELDALGLPEIPVGEVTEEAVTNFNRAAVREAGVPGGGGIATAADLALFYQGVLGHRGPQLWQPETVEAGTRNWTGELRDPFLPIRANRGLGMMVAGEGPEASMRGFGKTLSPRAFGHGGAGGQIGWADPESGLSFAFVTSGFDRHTIRQARRGVALSSRAGACLSDRSRRG